jgi:hypothetical protein
MKNIIFFLQKRGDHFLCPELLLPMRKPSGDYGTGRRVEILLVSLLVKSVFFQLFWGCGTNKQILFLPNLA